MIDIVEKCTICRNRQPLLKPIHVGWPHVKELASGALLCVYRCGPAAFSAGGYLYKSRSTDGGRSWQDEGPIWAPDEPHWDYRGSWLAQTHDREVVLT